MYIEEYIRRVLFVKDYLTNDVKVEQGAVAVVTPDDTSGDKYLASIYPRSKLHVYDSDMVGGYTSIYVSSYFLMNNGVRILSPTDPEWFEPERHAEINDEQDY